MPKLKKVLTVVCLLLAVFWVSVKAGESVFDRQAAQDVKLLFHQVKEPSGVLTEKDIEGLPQVVKEWLSYAGVIGKERTKAVRTKQTARMRLDPAGRWMPVSAEQYFTTDKPGFVWKARIKAAPLIHIAGRDQYQDGRGNMLIKALSLFTVADASGEEIDQGSLLRYLAETIWFPDAVVHEAITWEEIDSHRARATMNYGGIEASGVFQFNERGQVVSFEAERFGDFDGVIRKETWLITVDDYKEFEGVKVPTEGGVTWKLKEGDWLWYRFVVEDIEYNRPERY